MAAVTREAYADTFAARVRTEVLDLCTTCGKCAEACPMVPAAGITSAPGDLTRGILSLLDGGPVDADAADWVKACSSSGLCADTCAYGVDPMFMIEMARVALLQRDGLKQVQANATRAFQGMTKSVRYLSRLFLEPAMLDRLSPKSARSDGVAPEAVFYTGCNVLRTPHIALICLDILDLLGIRYEVMGGPSHCCGTYQIREGDIGAASNMALNTIGKMVKAAAPEVISWCPSCQLQFGRNHLPTYAAAQGGETPFAFTMFYRFLDRHLADLAPKFTRSVHKTVMLDERSFEPEVNVALRRILGAIPGLSLVEANQRDVGMMRNMISLPAVKSSSREEAFAAAIDAGVTTFATVYHACHREVVSYSDHVSFEIINAIELIADALGIPYQDSYKEFQRVADIDKFIEDRMDMVVAHGMSLDELRAVALKEFAAQRPVC